MHAAEHSETLTNFNRLQHCRDAAQCFLLQVLSWYVLECKRLLLH